MSDITVIVPTRGRPQKALELVRAFERTCHSGSTTLVLGLDDDDPELEAYKDALQVITYEYDRSLRVGAGRWARVAISPRLGNGMVGKLNKLARFHANQANLVGFMGDDHRPRSEGWDKAIGKALAEVPIVYGNDLFQQANLPTAVFMRGGIVERLGYMAPPALAHLYVDNVWLAWGNRLGIRYLGDVVIEHMHPEAGKSEWDDRYRDVNGPGMWSADKQAFDAYMLDGLEADLVKLQEVPAAA